MTNRFLDSCAHLATADIPAKYPSANTTGLTVSATGGRFGGPAYTIGGNQAGTLPIVLDAQATFIVGYGYKAATLSQAGILAQWYDGATLQCSVYLNTNGTVSAYRGSSGGTLLGTSSLTIAPASYPYIECLATVHNTTGVITVKANETAILTLTGLNNRSSAANQATEVRLANGNSVAVFFCDLYVNDGAGAAPDNTFWGDTKVEAKFPTGTGATNAWAANGAANAWDCVDESAPDGDTTYISSATPGQIATFVTQDVAAGATVRGVQTVLYARKDDAGARTIAPVVRSGGADNAGSNKTLSASYLYYLQQWPTDPNTAAAWSAVGFNAAEFGVKEVA